MKKMIFDETGDIDGKTIFEMLIKDGENSLLGMPAFEVSEKIYDVLTEYIKTIRKPYVDETEGFLDEKDLITNNNSMKERLNQILEEK